VWKAELREAETRAAIGEVEIKNMELQMQKKLFEQVTVRVSLLVCLRMSLSVSVCIVVYHRVIEDESFHIDSK